MTEQEKIRKYNLMLQNYINKKSYVKIFRTVCGKEENLSGFILGMSKNFLFLQLDNEFVLDGYAVIRLDDFDSVRHSSYERTQRKILAGEGILAAGYGFEKSLPLSNWSDILKTLKSYDIHVIIENINKGELDFWIGPIKRVASKSVSIHNYDPDGTFDKKATLIKIASISILKFGDRYSTIFRKYLKKRKN